ncbi:MAG: hypothetical protein ACREXY_27395 [Gammaproteobacteria bacterium]
MTTKHLLLRQVLLFCDHQPSAVGHTYTGMETKRPHIPTDLPAVWRERAEWLREYGDPNSARLWLVPCPLEGLYELIPNQVGLIRTDE